MLSKKITLGFCFLLLIMGCSKGKEESSFAVPTTIPNVEDEKAKEPLTFSQFIDSAHLAYQKRDKKTLEQLLLENKNHFTKESEQEEIKLLEGMLCLFQKDYPKAKEILTPLSKSSNTFLKGRALFYLGESERLNGKLKDAISLYLSAHKIFPSDEIYSSLGDTYSQMGNWKKGIFYYKEVLKTNPSNTQDLFLLGAAYYKNRELEKSAQTMRELLQKDPKNKYGYQYLAHIAKDKGNMRDYYYNLSRGIFLMREYKAVAEFLEKAPMIYKDAELSSMLISALVRDKQKDKALEVYKRTIKEKPSLAKTPDFEMYYGILSVLPKDGYDKGKVYFQNLYKKYPKNFLIVSSYIEVLRALNKEDPNLEALYREGLYIDPSDTLLRYELAEWYQKQNNLELAQLEYGILYYYQNQKEEALESLLDLERKAPNLSKPSLFLYIGLLYQQNGEKDLAREYYKKALKQDKNNAEAIAGLKSLHENRA